MKKDSARTEEHTMRRKQLMQIAAELFMTEGYEASSIQQIIDRAEVAKGTFYHYFSSKEELLNELILTQARDAIAEIAPAMEEEGLDAASRFNRLHRSIGMWKLGNREVIFAAARTLYRDENLVYRKKLNRTSIELMLPLYTDIIRQGIEEGIFSNSYPEETAELLLHMSQSWGDVIVPIMLEALENPAKQEEFRRRLEAFQYVVQRILGAEEGVIDLYPPELIDSFFEENHDEQDTTAHKGPAT